MSQLDDWEALVDGKEDANSGSGRKRKKSKGLVKASAAAGGGLGSDDEALMDEGGEEEGATQPQSQVNTGRRGMVLEDSDDE